MRGLGCFFQSEVVFIGVFHVLIIELMFYFVKINLGGLGCKIESLRYGGAQTGKFTVRVA